VAVQDDTQHCIVRDVYLKQNKERKGREGEKQSFNHFFNFQFS
jgi:hypothetical protein